MVIVSSNRELIFLHLCFSFQVDVFSYYSFAEVSARGSQNWFDQKGTDVSFFVKVCFFGLFWFTSYLHGLRSERIVQYCFPCDDIKSFWLLVWAVFWSLVWICLYLLAVGFCIIDCWALELQSHFTFFFLCFAF